MNLKLELKLDKFISEEEKIEQEFIHVNSEKPMIKGKEYPIDKVSKIFKEKEEAVEYVIYFLNQNLKTNFNQFNPMFKKPKQVKNEHFSETVIVYELDLGTKEVVHFDLGFYNFDTGTFGFHDIEKLKGSFTTYLLKLSEDRNTSDGNYGNWDSMIKHFKTFAPYDVSFQDLDRKLVENFRTYLDSKAESKSKKKLSQNSKYSYFNKFKAALKQAVKDGIIKTNPGEGVDTFKQGEPQREFLTLEELQKLVPVECELPELKRAFLFSALTGLRWSDIEKLKWSEIQHSNDYGYYIRFRQKKTKGAETQPISEQAVNLLGERKEPDDKIFDALNYSAWSNLKLQQWIYRAGIHKDITFHCARHTYATLQLTLGTDIYTVSKMLGHKELRTTQIYAKIIDEKKHEAANKIKLDF